MELCIALVERSLLHWCSPTLLDKWPVTEGRDGSHGEGLDTATRMYLQNCEGNEILLSSRQPALVILICKRSGNKRCEKSLQLRDMRCVPDSYASHLIFVP